MLLLFSLSLFLPDALLNRPYGPDAARERVSTRCNMPIPSTRVVAGELPPGLRMTGRGDVEGIPAAPGLFAFSVEVSDGCTRRIEERRIRVIPAPILTAEAEMLELRCGRGSPPFPGGIVRISGSAPGRAYSVDIAYGEEKPWLQAAMRDGSLPAEGSALESDTLRLTIDPGKLAGGVYTARLRVSTWQGANTPELLFRLRVDTPEDVLAALAAPPLAPLPPIRLPETEAPSILTIVPPAVPHAPPPRFPRYRPRIRKPTPPPAVAPTPSPARSRVLAFPKVAVSHQPAAGLAGKKEPAPEHAKPPAPSAKPKPAH